MFRKFTFMIIIPALLALGAGMAAGWAMQPSGHTDTKLDAMIAIHEPSTGMQLFPPGKKPS